MAFCPQCKIEQFGGGRCSRCGRRLAESKSAPAGPVAAGTGRGLRSRPLPHHIEILERESRYKVDAKRRSFLFYLGAFSARCVESAFFCIAFHFALVTVFFMLSAITELTRTGGEIYEASWPQEFRYNGKWIRFYEYFAFVLITVLTFKYRWPKK